MRILVDKMPRNFYECPFSTTYVFKNERYWVCQFDGLDVKDICPESCNYLAKGAVACELAVEADGEAEAGKAV